MVKQQLVAFMRKVVTLGCVRSTELWPNIRMMTESCDRRADGRCDWRHSQDLQIPNSLKYVKGVRREARLATKGSGRHSHPKESWV